MAHGHALQLRAPILYLAPLRKFLCPLPLSSAMSTPCRRSHIRRPPRLAPATLSTFRHPPELASLATSSSPPAAFDARAHQQPSPAARVSGAAAPLTPASSIHPPSTSYLSPSPCLISGRVFSSRCAEKREINKSQIQHASMPWTLDERRSRRPTAQNKRGATMAAAKGSSGGVEGVTPERLDGLIRGYAGLVDKVHSMKAFHWGTDMSIENMHQGFTHVFESTFESTERASGIEALSHYSITAWTRRRRRRRHLNSTGDHPLQHQKQQSLLAATDNPAASPHSSNSSTFNLKIYSTKLLDLDICWLADDCLCCYCSVCYPYYAAAARFCCCLLVLLVLLLACYWKPYSVALFECLCCSI